MSHVKVTGSHWFNLQQCILLYELYHMLLYHMLFYVKLYENPSEIKHLKVAQTYLFILFVTNEF